MRGPGGPGRVSSGLAASLLGSSDTRVVVDQPWHRQARPNGRTATIARLIERLTAERGRPPGDDELAALLAISVAAVRRHIDMIKRGR